MAKRLQGALPSEPRSKPRRHRNRVDPTDQLTAVGQRKRPCSARDLLRAFGNRVDDGHEPRSLEGRENARMVAPEVADADDSDSQRRTAHVVPRPTIVMRASFADANT
jgi:hypothetical protein